MANSASHASLPFPVKNARFSILVPYLDADGDPTDPTTPDTEFSGDAGAFADCAEEVTTISGSNGVGYITLTGAETNYSMVALAAKVASGPKNTLATLYPRVLPVEQSGTAQAGAAGTITLASGAAAIDDYYNGCIVKTTGGTGGGGTGGANNQARVITDYAGSTKVATISPNWETNPSSDTTYEVLLTDMACNAIRALQPTVAARTLDVSTGGEAGVDWANVGSPTTTVTLSGTTVKTATDVETDTQDIQGRLPAALGANGNIKADVRDFNAVAGTFASGRPEVNTTHWKGTAAATVDTAGYPVVTVKDGTGAGEIDSSSGTVIARSIGTGGIVAGSFAAGAIDAAAIATDAIGAAELAADAVTEIQSGLSTLNAAGVRTAVGLASANLDTQLAAIQADTDNLQTRVPAALVSGRMDASVGAMAAGVVTATAIADGAIDAATFASGTLATTAELVDGVWDEATSGHQTAGTTGEAISNAGGGSSPSAIADAVWDELLSGHQTAGSAGEALDGAGSGGATIYGEDGALEFTYTVYKPGGTDPLEGAAVYVSADVDGDQRSSTKVTDALGRVIFNLDASTVYFWTSHPRYAFTNPDTEVVS